MKANHFSSITVARLSYDVNKQPLDYFEKYDGSTCYSKPIDEATTALAEGFKAVLEKMQPSEKIEIILLARRGGEQ